MEKDLRILKRGNFPMTGEAAADSGYMLLMHLMYEKSASVPSTRTMT